MAINIYNYAARHESPVCAVELRDCLIDEGAQPTSRNLSGTCDFWAAEEWAQPATLPDGRKVTLYYLFSPEQIVGRSENPLDAENYNWSADNISWGELFSGSVTEVS